VPRPLYYSGTQVTRTPRCTGSRTTLLIQGPRTWPLRDQTDLPWLDSGKVDRRAVHTLLVHRSPRARISRGAMTPRVIARCRTQAQPDCRRLTGRGEHGHTMRHRLPAIHSQFVVIIVDTGHLEVHAMTPIGTSLRDVLRRTVARITLDRPGTRNAQNRDCLVESTKRSGRRNRRHGARCHPRRGWTAFHPDTTGLQRGSRRARTGP